MRLPLSFAALCAPALVAAEPFPTEYLGLYVKPQPVCFASLQGDGCEGTRNETIAVRRKSQELVYVAVDLIFHNGHRCAYYGVGRWRSGKLLASSPHPSSGKICRLEISINGNKASFKEHSGDCSTPGFCSARGGLGGEAGFTREP